MVDSGYRGNVPFVMRQSCPAHEGWSGTFDHYLLSITLEGGCCYALPNGRADITVNDLLCFTPGAWQNWRATADGWTVYYLIVDVPLPMQELLPPDNLDSGIARVQLPERTQGRVKDAFAEMIRWSERRTVMSHQLILNQLEYVLLLIRDAYPLEMVDDRIERARSFLHDCLESSTMLDDVAQVACLSKSRLCDRFKDVTDTSPLQYLERLRMERAAQLLTFSPMTIDAIAERLCYNDRKYFDKRFKRHWQVSPFRYRKQNMTNGNI